MTTPSLTRPPVRRSPPPAAPPRRSQLRLLVGFLTMLTLGLQLVIYVSRHHLTHGVGYRCEVTGLLDACRDGLVCRPDPGGGTFGRCTGTCDDGRDCPDGWSCVAVRGSGDALCRPPPTGGFGAPCEDGLDCRSGQCLQVTPIVALLASDVQSVCGEPCGPGGTCPAGAECQSVAAEPGQPSVRLCFAYEQAARLAEAARARRLSIGLPERF